MVQRHRRRDIERWLQKREREGLTYREASERSGIPAPTLAWWHRRLTAGGRPDGRGRTGGDLVRVEVVEDEAERAPIEVHVGEVVKIVAGPGVSEAHLTRVLRAVAASGC